MPLATLEDAEELPGGALLAQTAGGVAHVADGEAAPPVSLAARAGAVPELVVQQNHLARLDGQGHGALLGLVGQQLLLRNDSPHGPRQALAMASRNHLDAPSIHPRLLPQPPGRPPIRVPGDGAAPRLPLVEEDGAVEDDAARDARARHPLEQGVRDPREEALVLLQPLDLPVRARPG